MNIGESSTKKIPVLKTSLVYAAFGTGSVFMALSQGSGELIWWPYIVGKYGLAFVFLLLPACLLQYPVTYGICRYTALTGESIFRGFHRFNKQATFVLWILFTLSFLWFGAYATAGATALVELLPNPFSDIKTNVYFWAVVTVIIYFSFLFIGRDVYTKIEKVMMFISVFTLLALLVSLYQNQVRSQIIPVLKASFIPHSIPSTWDKEDSLRLLTAIMFAGLGGFWNLFNSYWIMAKRTKVASVDSDEFSFDKGIIPERDSQVESRWNKFLHLHVSIGTFGNYLTTLFMCILAFAFLTPKGEVPYGWKLAVVQSAFFGSASWLFLIIAALFLIDTWLTTLDAVAKVQVDMLQLYFPKTKTIKPKTIYYLMAVIILFVTLVTMFLSQPGSLLLINGYISAISMPVLIAFVFLANYFVLRDSYFGKQRVIKLLLAVTLIVYTGLFIGYIILS